MRGRITALALSAAILLTLNAVPCTAAEESGACRCGTYASGIHWSYDIRNSCLKLYGTGRAEGSGGPEAELLEEVSVIVVGSGVTALGDGLFAELPQLERVYLSPAVTSVGARCFAEDEELTQVLFSTVSGCEKSCLSSIGAYAFADTGLTSFTVPEGQGADLSIGAYAFADTPMTELTLLCAAPAATDYLALRGMPEGCTVSYHNPERADDGLYACWENWADQYTEYSWVEKDGTAAAAPDLLLENGWTLTDADVIAARDAAGNPVTACGGTVTAIGADGTEEHFFGGRCGEELYWRLSEGVLTVSGSGPMYDFYGLTPWVRCEEEITAVHVTEGCTVIGEQAFCGCRNLTAVRLADSVTDPGDGAFWGCEGLESAALGAGLKSLPDFSDCGRLKEVNVSEGNPLYTSVNGIVYAKNGGEALLIPAASEQKPETTEPETTETPVPETTEVPEPTAPESSEPGPAETPVPESPETTEPDTPEPVPSESSEPEAPVTEAVTERFTDVHAGDWYVPYVQEAVDLGIMSGTGAHTFEPYTRSTRGMIVQILYARAGYPSTEGLKNPFRDVKEGDWYYDAVLWAYENSVTGGTSADTFSPEDPVRREELAVLLWAYAGRPEERAELTRFEDLSAADDWAVPALSWAVSAGVLSGTNEGGHLLLDPQQGTTRAETATMITGFLRSGAVK